MTMLRLSPALLAGLFMLGTAQAQTPRYWPGSPAVATPGDATGAPRFSWKPLRFIVALEAQTQWMLPDSTRALWGQRAQPGGGLSVEYQALRLGPAQTLGVDLSIVSQKSERWIVSGMQRTSASRVGLGISLAHAWRAWCSPYGRLAMGYGSTKFSLGPDYDALSDRRRFVEGSLGAGIALRTAGLRLGQSERFVLSGVLRVEGGYLLGNSQSFALRLDDPAGVAPLPQSSLDVGTARHRAPYLRISFGLGF